MSQSQPGWFGGFWGRLFGPELSDPVNGPTFRKRIVEPASTLESHRARPQYRPPADSMHEGAPQQVAPRVTPAATWVYQLQKIDVDRIAASNADVAVIDYSPDGDPKRPFTAEEVARMKAKPGGGQRKLISYMSIGEANKACFYWDNRWVSKSGKKTSAAPAWLDKPNSSGWEGAWKVKFWDRAWQAVIIDRPDSYLNKIIDQGFDGVYLDIIDGYAYWMDEDRGQGVRPTAGDDMVAFVARIGEHARLVRGKPDFLVVPQNGEALLRNARYRNVISGIGKEDILFDMVGDADKNPHVAERQESGQSEKETIASIMADLKLGLAERPPVTVLAVEYLRDWPEDIPKQAHAANRMRELGFVPYLANRDLACLCPVIEPPPGAPMTPVA